MRIDHDLCRAILVAVESNPQAGTGAILNVQIDGYEPLVIAQHVKHLWEQELISGIDVTHMQSPCVPEIAVRDITPAGREYLDRTEPEAPKQKIGF